MHDVLAYQQQTIKAGEGVIAATQSANRDETVFGANADNFDIHRQTNPHLAFGYGAHECVAEWLARAELQCVFGEPM
jgi:fungal nitric oxide reductase